MVRDKYSDIQRITPVNQALEDEIEKLTQLVDWHIQRRGDPSGTAAFQRLQELIKIKKHMEAQNGS